MGSIGSILWPLAEEIAGLSPHQAEQYSLATRGRIGVLAGRPGTGKTYTVAAMLRRLVEVIPREQIAVAAPTGKAAVRVAEAMQRSGVDLGATTIHSLLQVESGEDGWSFIYGERKPLPSSVIVIDEASMLDTDLFRALLAARGRGAHILIVGDPNQLPPVGHGAPLRDMLAARVSHGELREIQRNSGRIVRACHEMIDRQRFEPSPKIDLDAGENLAMVEREDAAGQIKAMADTVGRIMRGGTKDPIWDVQVLVAVNKKSELSRRELNKVLQGLLNPPGDDARESSMDAIFRVGDKIINTKNSEFDDLASLTAGDRPPLKRYVANGEQGEVLSLEPGKMVVRLWAPDREVVVYKGPSKPDRGGSDGGIDSDDDNGSGDDDNEGKTNTGCSWELGYAISTHKSQGSEWPIVIVMADSSGAARRVCTRQWIYTAVSRAREVCVVIGERKVVDAMCKRDGLSGRKTFLRERIEEVRAAAAVEGIAAGIDWG